VVNNRLSKSWQRQRGYQQEGSDVSSSVHPANLGDTQL
jgi:hypothetical protein